MCATRPEERGTPSAQPSGWDSSAPLNSLPSTSRLAIQHILPLTDQSVPGTLPCCTLDPLLIQFLGWKTAEDNCNRRTEVTLEEKQGVNKQEGAVRALHEEERYRFIVVGKKKKDGHVMLIKYNVFPTLGLNGSTPVFLLFLNSTAPVARHCRTRWRAWRTREREGLEICVEKLRLVLFF